MSGGFVKIYGKKLLNSTLWDECWQARLVFVGMLAEADANGVVDIPSIAGLARRMNLSIEDVDAGLKVLEAPDPHSRSKEAAGRRLVRGEDHWQVVNYGKYREFRTDTQEKTRTRVAKHRALQVTPVTRTTVTSTPEAEAEAEAKGEEERASAPPLVRVAADLESENAQRPALAGNREPARLTTAMADAISFEFERRGKPAPSISVSQRLAACQRVQSALDLKLFDNAIEAIETLVKTAADAVEKDPKKKFVFEIADIPFTKPRAEDEPQWLKDRRLIPINF